MRQAFHRTALLATFALGLPTLAQAAVQYYKWTPVTLPVASGASCGNGTPARVFVNRTPMTTKTLVYFEGGGACWNQNSCLGKGKLTDVATNPNGVPENYLSQVNAAADQIAVLHGVLSEADCAYARHMGAQLVGAAGEGAQGHPGGPVGGARQGDVFGLGRIAARVFEADNRVGGRVHSVRGVFPGQVAELGPSEALFSHPLHPYTKALLSSMPSMDPDRRTLEAPLAGDPPNPINPPSGCRFHTRCASAEPMCSQRMPSLAPAAHGQIVSCWKHVAGSGHTAAAGAGAGGCCHSRQP